MAPKPVTTAAWPVRTVGQRLQRMAALSALIEGMAIALPPGASRHDYSLDAELYAGLGAVANVIREDFDAVSAVLDSKVLDMTAPPADYTDDRRARG